MQRILIAGAIGTVLLGTTIGVIVYKNKNTNHINTERGINYNDLDDVNNGKSNSPIPTSGAKSDGTLEKFFNGKMGNNISCRSLHKVGKDQELEVVSYISGSKIRANYYLIADGLGWRNAASAITNLNIIYDGEFAFIWGDAFLGRMMQGMKYKLNFSENGKIEKPDSEMTPEMLDFDTPLFDCRPWTPTKNAFNIPEEIPFVEINDEGEIEELFIETVEGGEIDINDLLKKDPADPCFGCGIMPDSMKADCYAGCQ